MAPPKRPPEGLYAEALTASAKSLDALRRLTALPESPELHEVEADAARLRGAFSESVAALRKAVALRPGDRRLEKILAQSLLLNRNFEEAAPLLRKYGMDKSQGRAVRSPFGVARATRFHARIRDPQQGRDAEDRNEGNPAARREEVPV